MPNAQTVTAGLMLMATLDWLQMAWVGIHNAYLSEAWL